MLRRTFALILAAGFLLFLAGCSSSGKKSRQEPDEFDYSDIYSAEDSASRVNRLLLEAQDAKAAAVEAEADKIFADDFDAVDEDFIAVAERITGGDSRDYSKFLEDIRDDFAELERMAREKGGGQSNSGGADGEVPLPAYYVVQPGDTFLDITRRSYIYNDARLWQGIYQANRNIMPEPDNPDLISVGMRLRIPSVSGETREGEYDPRKKYPAFGRK